MCKYELPTYKPRIALISVMYKYQEIVRVNSRVFPVIEFNAT